MVLGRFENNLHICTRDFQNDIIIFDVLQKSTNPHVKNAYFGMFLHNMKK
jgi:hypothetical protein